MQRGLDFMKKPLLSILLLSTFAFAGRVPDSAWKTGLLKRVSSDPVAPTTDIAGKKAVRHRYAATYYFIQSGEYLYEGETLHRKSEKDFSVDVNAPVKFLLSGMDMYLRDNKGKQHKLLLLNTIRTAEAEAEQPK